MVELYGYANTEIMKIITLLLINLLVFSLISCDLPDHYFDATPACITENSADLTIENQLELIASLRKKQPNDFRYFFKTFIEEERHTYMITNFRNEVACFDMKILVDKWDKLAGMKRTNDNLTQKNCMIYNGK